jgi:two-component system NtrC family sensor kinase
MGEKHRYLTIFESLPQPIVLLDERDRLVNLNVAARRLLEGPDRPTPHCCGRPLCDLLTGWLQDEITYLLSQNNSSVCVEKQLETAGGRRYFVISLKRMEDAGGRPDGSIIMLDDITEHREINLELQRNREELETAYNELKATQSRILQQEKMASIGQLAAGVAHEINNPIGFVTSNLVTLEKYRQKLDLFMTAQAELLARGAVSPDDASLLGNRRRELKIDHIRGDIACLIAESLDGTERVRKIVADLKRFSRVDQAELTHADLNECLESTLNIVWNELKYKATVNRDLGDLPLTKCYPQQLNQVFMNLLVNAGHAIERQGTIDVRSWCAGDLIHVSVTDTGYGIPPEVQQRIFEPFFTTKPVGKGTGLGLSISYDIVKKHGGEIQVMSEVGKGSTFEVQIPIVEGR